MSTNTDPSESTEQEAEWKKTHHVYARQLYYPGSTVKRFPVPEEKVPWEVPEHKFSSMRTSLSIFNSVYLTILFTYCVYLCMGMYALVVIIKTFPLQVDFSIYAPSIYSQENMQE